MDLITIRKFLSKAVNALSLNTLPEKNTLVILSSQVGVANEIIHQLYRDVDRAIDEMPTNAMMAEDENRRKQREQHETIAKFRKILREDLAYFQGFKVNIAMAFADQVARDKKAKKKQHLNSQDVHEAANVAAVNFLQLFVKE